MPETVHPRKIRSSTKNSEARPKTIISDNDLVPKFLAVLEVRIADRGLTYGELAKTCGIAWRRGLALHQKLKKNEAAAADIQAFVYDLWKSGKLFVEPPARGQKACRIWPVQAACGKFPSACVPPGDGSPILSEQSLRAVYDKFVAEHIGGFVPIYKVRRELRGFREAFDDLLRDLNERPEPVIELFPSDPRELTEDQKHDSLKRGGTLLVRMKWR